jgi:hypothetical protein
MTRFFLVLVLLNAVLAMGLSLKELTARTEGGGAAICTQIPNGDSNQDAALNISDAVYILNFLFSGGPEPAPRFVADWACVAAVEADLAARTAERDAALASLAACNAEKEAALSNLAACEVERNGLLADLETCRYELARSIQPPATGQTKCYDDSVPPNEISCNSTEYPGQDGFHQAGCPTQNRFIDNLNGTVTDSCTGLMWQRSSAGTYNWQAALQYSDGLDLGGHTDWRLPNLRELRTLVDYSGVLPAIDPVFQAIEEVYWTSSSFNGDLTHAWTVGFQEGEGNSHEAKVDPFPVRAVRGGP